MEIYGVCYYDEDDYQPVDVEYEDIDCSDDMYGSSTIEDDILKCCKMENVIHLLQKIVDDCVEDDTRDAIKLAVNCLRNEIRNCSIDDEF